MKKTIFILFVLVCFMAKAQTDLKPIAREVFERTKAQEKFTNYEDLFAVSKNTEAQAKTSLAVDGATLMNIQPKVLNNLLKDRRENVALSIPYQKGNLSLKLYLVDIYAEGFSIETSDGSPMEINALHYRGIVNDDPSRVVGVSILENEVMGLVYGEEGNLVLGKMDGQDSQYVLYPDDKLEGLSPPTCDAIELDDIYESEYDSESAGLKATKCVSLYWEVDYPVYQDKKNNTANFITGIFNQSKILFDNDDIAVKLSQLYIWKSGSPYGNGNTRSRLDAFKKHRTSYNGSMAHLIGYGGGGGIAWVSQLCNKSWAYAYSGINGSFNNFPTYSWSVMVVTHEQGHVMGSPHTHSCSWNGNSTAIDGCAKPEGSCARPGIPSGGGTIMSYCHTQSAGINLHKGFGPQPGARIRNFINSRSCVGGSCAGDPGFCGWQIQNGQAIDLGAYGSDVYIIGTNNYLYKSSGNGNFHNVDDTKKIKRLDVHNTGVFAIDMENNVLQFQSGNWLNKNSKAIDIGCGNGGIFIIDMQNKIRKYLGNGNWSDPYGSGRGRDIDVMNDGSPWVRGTNDLMYQWSGGKWNSRGSFKIRDLSINPKSSVVVVIGMDQSIRKYIGNGNYEKMPGAAVRITITSQSMIWLVNGSNKIYAAKCATQSVQQPIISALQEEKSELKIYPNPVTEETLLIDGVDSQEPLNIQIMNIQGQVIYQHLLEGASYYELQLPEGINSGLFIVTVQGTETQHTQKLLVQ